ncbi:hypothetical protein M405DRAFT_846383 [Rhizopogon salebrosus TDB-379]|nr:hypothetical protein M405DRAFT_846383 [Rhizopogon salebrosus TDB-379]
MPAARWTTVEQFEWLQERLADYAHHTEQKDYSRFWPETYAEWFKKWPERAVIFPHIAPDIPLTKTQENAIQEAYARRKIQLQTWFRWRTNGSKKNRGLKKDSTVFDAALQPKTRAKSVEEIYMDMVYDERIKPLVKAEEEAGNVAMSGRRIALGRKFSKVLLEDESDDIKKEVRARYEKQLTGKKKSFLDDDGSDDGFDDKIDPDTISQGIDELPIICQRFARLVKKKTRFIVSFMCAGRDPRCNWDMVTLSCHPSETAAGHNFTNLFPNEDNQFLGAFQQYAEEIFATPKQCDAPPASADIENLSVESQDIENAAVTEERDDDEEESCREESCEEENEQDTGTMDLNDPSLYQFSQTPDASAMSNNASANASATAFSDDASQVPAVFLDASATASDASLLNGFVGVNPTSMFYTQAQSYASLGGSLTYPNQAIGMGDYVNSNTSSTAAQGSLQAPTYAYEPFTVPDIRLAPSDPPRFTFTDTIYVSAERSTTNAEQDIEALPQFAHQLPILPAANPPSPMYESLEHAAGDIPANTGMGHGNLKSKRKRHLPSQGAQPPPTDNAAASAKSVSTAKPKVKPKARLLAKPGLSAVTEMMGAATNEGQGHPRPTAVNGTMQAVHPPSVIGLAVARTSKRIPIKSRRNDIADSIGSDGTTLKFVGIGIEKPLDSGLEVGATEQSTSRIQECVNPSNSKGKGERRFMSKFNVYNESCLAEHQIWQEGLNVSNN